MEKETSCARQGLLVEQLKLNGHCIVSLY